MADKKLQAAQLLLHHRTQRQGFWSRLALDRPTSLADANVFFLGAILDYQIPSERAWENGRRLAEDIAGDAEHVWAFIAAVSLSEWNERRQQYSLHRYPKAHERVWRIAKDICRTYHGDPRKIWERQSVEDVLARLNRLRVGEQISRMIVGALIDTGKVAGRTDVKPDIHVRHVLGRVLRGSGFTLSEVDETLELTREMSPENPWLIDEQLYRIGKGFCRPKVPKCSNCYLALVCTFFNRV